MPKGNSNNRSVKQRLCTLFLIVSCWAIGFWMGSASSPMRESLASNVNDFPTERAAVSSGASSPSGEASSAARSAASFAASSATCDLTSNLLHISQNPQNDYPNQAVAGPMQADEMLLMFALTRTTFVSRVLEIGGFHGDSAWNWLEALRCKTNGVVYTVDRNPVPSHSHPVVKHTVLQMDAANLTLADVNNEPIDLLLLDCHDYAASQHILNALVFNKESPILSKHGFIVLHDTGMHPTTYKWPFWMPNIHTAEGVIHQPVERLLADWIPLQDCSFQRVSFHDDHRVPTPRHGLTILQRRLNLEFSECLEFAQGQFGIFGYTPEACQQVHDYTAKTKAECPI